MTAQLISAADGYHLWSERYDRELIDVFAVQDEIAQSIAGALQVKLVSNPARHTPDVPAYEALLKARHYARTYVPEAHARAEDYCKQAIALDPMYAAPHALLGFIYLFDEHAHGQAHAGGRAPLRHEASRALELDPSKPTRIFCSVRWRLQSTTTGWERPREFQSAIASPSASAEARWAYASFSRSRSAASMKARRKCVGPWKRTR